MALLLAEEASEQVYPLDRLFLGARLLALAELLAARVLISREGGRGGETGGGRRLSVLGAGVSARDVGLSRAPFRNCWSP